MAISLVTYPPQGAHVVLEIVAAVGFSKDGIFRAPDLGIAMQACRAGLRLRAQELGADMVAGCQFQVDFGSKAVNVTGFGTAIRIASSSVEGNHG